MKKLILIILCFSPLFSLESAPTFKFEYQMGLPSLVYRPNDYYLTSTNFVNLPSVRDKFINYISMPIMLDATVGYIFGLNPSHSLVGFLDVAYESDPMSSIISRDRPMENEFNTPDQNQDSINTLLNVSHRWSINDFLNLSSSIDFNILAVGSGRGDFVNNHQNANSIGFSETLLLYNLNNAIEGAKENHYLKNTSLAASLSYHINYRPNDSELGLEDLDVLKDKGYTNEDFTEIKETYNDFSLGITYLYNPVKDLFLDIDYEFNIQKYPEYKINDTNGVTSETEDRKYLQNTFSFNSTYETLYTKRRINFFQFGFSFYVHKNNGNYVDFNPIAPDSLQALVDANNSLPADQQIGFVYYAEDVITSNTNFGGNITNQITNVVAHFPNYHDFLVLAIEPSVKMNFTKRLSFTFLYSFSKKSYPGQYTYISDHNVWEQRYEKSHLFHFSFQILNRTGRKKFLPFIAMQFLQSNDKRSIYDLYTFGLSTVFEF